MKVRRIAPAMCCFATAALIAFAASASPCSGIDTPFPANLWPQWQRVIARQLDVRQVKPLAYLLSAPWCVIEVSAARASDLPAQVAWVVYPTDPRSAPLLATLWANSAPKNANDLRKWLLERAPGIPPKLADCVAYRVLRGR